MLVGRDPDLEVLHERVAARTPTVVVGEPGVGKTAMMRAAVADLCALEGGALQTLSWMPYLCVERALGRRLPDADATWVAVELEKISGDRPVLFDDLQWAHPSTIEVVSLLAGRVPILVAVRSGDRGTESALSALLSSGYEQIALEPLGHDEAMELVRRIRPDAGTSLVQRLWQRTGGNPLLIEELSATEEPSDTLRLSISARLRALSPHAREAATLLALAERPLAAASMRSGLKELETAGLLNDQPDGVTLRHALIGEVIVEQLGEDECAALHVQLAALAESPGDMARHFAAAGRRVEALSCALDAAERSEHPTERAAHLAVAASCASGPEVNDLKLRAADEVLRFRSADEAEIILNTIETADPVLQAHVHHLRSRIAWSRGSSEAYSREIEAGLSLLEDSVAEVRVDLLVNLVRFTLMVKGDNDGALEGARRAIDVARSLAYHEQHAQCSMGLVQIMRGDAVAARTILAGALDAAIEEDDHELAFQAGVYLRVALRQLGERDAAQVVDERLIKLAQSLRRKSLELRHRAALLSNACFSGPWDEMINECRRLLDEPLSARARDDVRFTLARCLLNAGRFDELFDVLDRAAAEALPDAAGRGSFDMLRAAAEVWNGRPEQAIVLARTCAADERYAVVWTAECQGIEAWACFDLGRPAPDAPPLGDPSESSPSAAQTVQLRALAEVYLRPGNAAELFAEAARRWTEAGIENSAFRAMWAEGELHRRSGDEQLARQRLLEAERWAELAGAAPLLARIQRSLRLLGDRRSTKRADGSGALTARQDEILHLVGAGLTNTEIARRLGLSRSTVARQIASAMSKLGVSTRGQAATLVQR